MVRSRVPAFIFRRSKQRVVNEIFIRLAFYVHRERRFPSVSLEAINFFFFLLFALRCCLYGCHDDAKEEESAMRSRGDRCIYVVVIHYPRLVFFCSSFFLHLGFSYVFSFVLLPWADWMPAFYLFQFQFSSDSISISCILPSSSPIHAPASFQSAFARRALQETRPLLLNQSPPIRRREE